MVDCYDCVSLAGDGLCYGDVVQAGGCQAGGEYEQRDVVLGFGGEFAR